MTIDFGSVNYFAVIVGVVLNMGVGALWYSPVLFAKAWMKENNFTEEQLREDGGAYRGYAVSIVASIVMMLALAILVQATGASEPLDGLLLGLLAGVGLVAATQAPNYTFESKSIRHYAINTGYHVVVFAIVGVMMAVWQ